ncbi:SDR family oxidoreductase [Thiohalorhabdus sp. Cl-TMA]|uniref:SDR family oxidoreductase n=1 Tax=Thiohalorhabdus methylotrophus TaxID=3242694 RepID=A0ABV4TZE2_9GAMM
MELQDAVIIVTGAGRGIGRATALELARAGARVVAVARTAHGESGVAATVAAVEAAGGRARAEPADVRDAEGVKALMERVAEAEGHIDGLVNGAAVFAGERGLLDISPDQWSEVLDTNLTGAFLCLRAAAPHLIRAGGGVVVNMTSGAAVRTGFLNVAYGVSKAGLDRLTQGADAELRKDGILCVSLSPPVTRTETVEAIYGSGTEDLYAAEPERTARAVRKLIVHHAAERAGGVVTVRELMEGEAD